MILLIITLFFKKVFFITQMLGHLIGLFLIFFTQVLSSLSTLYLIYKVFTVL